MKNLAHVEFCFQDIPKIIPLSALPSLIVRINLPHTVERKLTTVFTTSWYWFLLSPPLETLLLKETRSKSAISINFISILTSWCAIRYMDKSMATLIILRIFVFCSEGVILEVKVMQVQWQIRLRRSILVPIKCRIPENPFRLPPGIQIEEFYIKSSPHATKQRKFDATQKIANFDKISEDDLT